MKFKVLLRSRFVWLSTIASISSFLIGWLLPSFGGVWFLLFFLLSILPNSKFYERLGQDGDSDHIFMFFLGQWFFSLIGLIIHFGR